MNSLPTLIIRTQSEAKIIGCMDLFSLVARGSFSSGARKQAEGEGIGGLRFFARGSLSSGVRKQAEGEAIGGLDFFARASPSFCARTQSPGDHIAFFFWSDCRCGGRCSCFSFLSRRHFSSHGVFCALLLILLLLLYHSPTSTPAVLDTFLIVLASF